MRAAISGFVGVGENGLQVQRSLLATLLEPVLATERRVREHLVERGSMIDAEIRDDVVTRVKVRRR